MDGASASNGRGRWAGPDPVLSAGSLLGGPGDPVLADLIAVVNRPGYDAWSRRVARIGGCSNPVRLSGATRISETGTGRVLEAFGSKGSPGGVVLIPCRDRRASVCPSCARTYGSDTYHLVRAGLSGGKGVPASVAGHVRLFVTLTAPSFGAVHTIRDDGACNPRGRGRCLHGNRAACRIRHAPEDAVLGAPLCGGCYDYAGAVVWQASLGALWTRVTIYTPRRLAALTGRTGKQVRAQVRLSYVKVVEFQRRGLVHVHAVIRADGLPVVGAAIEGAGTGGTTTGSTTAGDAGAACDPGAPGWRPAPDWVTPALLAEAVAQAVGAVRVRVDGGRAGAWVLAWGPQLDVSDLTTPAGPHHDGDGNGNGDGDDGDGGEKGSVVAPGEVVARYVAKYATKGTETTGWTIRDGGDGTPRAQHAARMAATALALAEVPELAGLKLGRWARTLGFRGHVSSRSRAYSTTLGALRAVRTEYARAAHRHRTGVDLTGYDPDALVVESGWQMVGRGWSPGEAVLAGQIARDAALNRDTAREALRDAEHDAARDGRPVSG